MKKIFLLAGAAMVFVACNNQPGTAGTSADTSSHAAHNETGDSPAGGHMAAMHKAMDHMMQGMKAYQPTGDPDYDFAALMKLHHQSAVAMANVLMKGGTDTSMKQHARHTVDEQQKEIDAFNRFLQAHKPAGQSDYGEKAVGQMAAMGDHKMETGSLEAMYASMMIPHHQDGVKMAEEYLKEGRGEELKKIAQSIIQTQPKEIADYRQWLSAMKQH